MITYYEELTDGTIGMSTTDKDFAEDLGLTLTTDREIVYGYDGKRYFAGEEPTRPVTFADYDQVMEAHLDSEKAERGYTKREPSDYAGSSNERWAKDAQDWIAHRDEVMEYGLEVENKSERGEPVPTLAEFKANLPKIKWTIASIVIMCLPSFGDYVKMASQAFVTNEVCNATNAISLSKQDKLISGSNIKTINGDSILGSGNIVVQGGGGVDTNAVRDIVNAEVGGTNTLVHTDAAWFVGVTNRAANARDKWDNVCHTNSFVWKPITLPSEVSFNNNPQPTLGETGFYYNWQADNGILFTTSETESPLEFYDAGTMLMRFVAIREKASSVGLPFVTYDNAPSTNGFVTASITNDVAAEVRGKANASDLENYLSIHGGIMDGNVDFNYIVTLISGWDSLKSTSDDGHTLPEYLASGEWNTKADTNKFLTVGGALAESDLWSESNANLTGTVAKVSAPIATNAAEYVVGDATNLIWNAIGGANEYLEFALGGGL